MGNNVKKLAGAGSSPRINSAVPVTEDEVNQYFESETFKRSGCL